MSELQETIYEILDQETWEEFQNLFEKDEGFKNKCLTNFDPNTFEHLDWWYEDQLIKLHKRLNEEDFVNGPREFMGQPYYDNLIREHLLKYGDSLRKEIKEGRNNK